MVGFSMAVVDLHEPVIYKNFGFADLQQNIAASENTIYRIGSVTKVFTAMAILKLRDEGKISLEDPVEDYLPALHFQYAPGLPVIKVRDLLTHTAGLPDNIDNGSFCSDPPAARTIITEVNKLYLTIPAGLKMNYSNIGYALLGCLIEKISGKSYADYVMRNFIIPMQMKETGILQSGEQVAGMALGYLPDSTSIIEPLIRDVAAGGMYGSTADLVSLCRLLMQNGNLYGKQLIDSATLQEMMTNQIGNVTLKTDDEFGYGLFINTMGSNLDSVIGKNIGHGGDTRVFHSIVAVFPKLQIGFVLLTNSEAGGNFTKSAVLQIAREYVRDVKGIPIQRGIKNSFSTIAREADDLDHSKIAGTYGSGGEDFVTIINKNDRKLIFRQDKNKLKLKKEADGIYAVTYYLLQIIPVKVKAASFAFVESGGRTYMKTLDNHSKSAVYISVKDESVEMPSTWKAKAGKYEVLNDCPGDMLLHPDELKIEGNKILLHRSDPLQEESDYVSFNPLNDHLAVSDGIDRGAGNTLQFLPNGNVYWSGYELKLAAQK